MVIHKLFTVFMGKTTKIILVVTFVGSLMLPRPRMRTRQSVLASTLLREFPLGPRRRPTKLNCKSKFFK